MKKILFIALGLFIFSAGMVTAATANQWKGFDIVKIFSGGKELKATDTPAVIIQGRSYVPLYMLREAGLTVSYNSSTKAVNVALPNQKPVEATQTVLTLEQLNTIGKSVGLVYQLDAQGKTIGTGSGFVTGSTFVTNWHVADGAAVSLLVDFGAIQKTVKVADAVFRNEEADLIGFKIEGVPGLTLNTGELMKGDKVYSLSYPHHRFTITEGEYLFTYKNAVSHTASITSGSSGGVVVDINGRLIGVTESGIEGKSSYAVSAVTLQQELDKMK